ncbi:MAG: hypothetical protein ACREH8_01285 [Opitutaceae bacterium]
MKDRTTIIVAVVLLALALAFTGCRRSREEIERERKRIEMEEQAQRDLQKANKAIGEIGKKIGRKVQLYDLGLPGSPEKKSEPAPAKAQQP